MWTHSELPATSCQMPCSPLTICFSQQFHHQSEISSKQQYNQSEQAKLYTANLALQYLKQCVCGHNKGMSHTKTLMRPYIRGMAQVQFIAVHNVFGSGKFTTACNVFGSGKFPTTQNVFWSGKFTTAHNVFESVTFTTAHNLFESVNFTIAQNVFGSGKFTTAYNVFVTNRNDRQLIHLLQIQNVSFYQQWTMIVPGHFPHQTQIVSVQCQVPRHNSLTNIQNPKCRHVTCTSKGDISKTYKVKVKVKFSPACEKRNEEAWRCTSTHSKPQHKMEVNGQLHTQAALPPGKGPLLPTAEEIVWAPQVAWTSWWRHSHPPTHIVFDVQLYIYGFTSKQFCYKHSFAPYTCQLDTNNKIFTLTQVVIRLFSAVFPCIIQRFEWETPAWCSQ